LLYLFHANQMSFIKITGEMNIGRTSGDLIFSDDTLMSSLHALIYPSEDEKYLIIEDLGSKNRTIVDRTEVIPQEKSKLPIFGLLEVGEQKFLLTDTENLSFNSLTERIDFHLAKPLKKLSFEIEVKDHVAPKNEAPRENPRAQANVGVATPALASIEVEEIELPPATPDEAEDELVVKERELKKIQEKLKEIEPNAKKELVKLEEMKEKIIQEARAKKDALMKLKFLKKKEKKLKLK
jgi:hypothetical protein